LEPFTEITDAVAGKTAEGVTADIERISKQDLHTETTVRLARLVAAAEPGAKLPTERELCEMLGVGRSTIREAVRSLSFIGALYTRQGSGTYVKTPDEGSVEKLLGLALVLRRSTVEEIVAVRRILEAESARLAAVNHNSSDRQDLAAVMEEMGRTFSEPQKASRCDLQYHVLLARASHNGVLAYLINGMRSLLEIWMNKAVNSQNVIEEIVLEHNRVLSAVFDRDPDLAAATMSGHLKKAAERLFAVLGKDHSTADYFALLMTNSR
jgi:GntR family transcriptional repressor for pyruvate dehydrogenase complex